MPILAIDLGLKRIGLAYSPDRKIAVPINGVLRKNRDQAAAEIRKIAAEYNIDHIIIGMPIGGGSESEMRGRVSHFITLLNLPIKIDIQDEADSSIEANELVGGRLKKKDAKLDSVSALIILERFIKREAR